MNANSTLLEIHVFVSVQQILALICSARDLLCRQTLAKVFARRSCAFIRVTKVHAHNSGADVGCTSDRRVPQVANLERRKWCRCLRRLILADE